MSRPPAHTHTHSPLEPLLTATVLAVLVCLAATTAFAVEDVCLFRSAARLLACGPCWCCGLAGRGACLPHSETSQLWPISPAAWVHPLRLGMALRVPPVTFRDSMLGGMTFPIVAAFVLESASHEYHSSLVVEVHSSAAGVRARACCVGGGGSWEGVAGGGSVWDGVPESRLAGDGRLVEATAAEGAEPAAIDGCAAQRGRGVCPLHV